MMIEFAAEFKLAQANYKRLDYKNQGIVWSKLLKEIETLELDIEYIPFLEVERLFTYVSENNMERKFINIVRDLFNKIRAQGGFILQNEITNLEYETLNDYDKKCYHIQYQEYISYQLGSEQWCDISETKASYTNNITRKIYKANHYGK